MTKRNPVHINTDGVDLFLVKGASESCLVLTRNGPMMAKQIGQHAMRQPASSVMPMVVPMLCTDERLMEQILGGAVEVMTRTQAAMSLYRFEVAMDNGTLGQMLVWTDQRLKAATAFAVEAVQGIGKLNGNVQVVGNPIVVDRSNVDSILDAG